MAKSLTVTDRTINEDGSVTFGYRITPPPHTGKDGDLTFSSITLLEEQVANLADNFGEELMLKLMIPATGTGDNIIGKTITIDTTSPTTLIVTAQ